MMEKFRLYQNYIIILIVSLICLFFFPCIGSTIDLAFNFPNTTAGWIVYVTSKLLVASCNILLLYCFYNQGKLNIRNDTRYLKACEILSLITETDDYKPQSPKEHATEVFGKKGVTIFLTSVLSSISLGQSILSFDWITMLTYLITIITGLIFGVIQMNSEEIYWTETFPKYANMIKEKKELNNDKDQ